MNAHALQIIRAVRSISADERRKSIALDILAGRLTQICESPATGQLASHQIADAVECAVIYANAINLEREDPGDYSDE